MYGYTKERDGLVQQRKSGLHRRIQTLNPHRHHHEIIRHGSVTAAGDEEINTLRYGCLSVSLFVRKRGSRAIENRSRGWRYSGEFEDMKQKQEEGRNRKRYRKWSKSAAQK